VSSLSELANSIENTIAIAFLSTIAIAIAIDKGIFQLLLLLLLLIRASSNYWYFNRNYCLRVLPLIWPFLVSKYTLWSLMHSRLNKNACFIQIGTPCKAHFSSRNCTIAIEILLLLTIFGTIAIDIAIAKDTSRLLLLVLLLLRGLSELLLLLLIAIFTIGQLCSLYLAGMTCLSAFFWQATINVFVLLLILKTSRVCHFNG